ncbi:MAG: c-type cytochrome, partial [Candidatus Hydrothermarchaeales archaeon]
MKSKRLVFFIILLIAIFAGCVGENAGEQVSTQGASKGKDIYLSNCAGCHGSEGKGDG